MIFLTVAELKRKARHAVKKGTLQATRAQKQEAYRGSCQYRHTLDPTCKCVVGHGLPDDFSFGDLHNYGVEHLISLKIIACDDEYKVIQLQCDHDDACTVGTDEERQTAYKKFLEAIAS